MKPVLYSFRRCPYAMRARMALQSAGINYEHREVALREKPAAMLTASPKGTVPVLVLGSGQVIEESRDVMDWALAQNDPAGWRNGVDIPLIEACEGNFKYHLDRYKYASRYKESASRGDTDIDHRRQAERFITQLENRLESGPYLTGNQQNQTDIAIFPFIRQFANTDKDWWQSAPYIQTQDWLERHCTAPIFLSIMQKHALWTAKAKI